MAWRRFSRFAAAMLLTGLYLSVRAGSVQPLSEKPGFVEAYLLVVQPGGALYSSVGHAVLRLKCAEHGLDYCFSYESEDVRERVLAFLSGRLKMGMFAIKTEACLSSYRADRRGVRQYRLNLPEAVKCRLWKNLDGKVAEGVALPYDYLRRGCAQAVLCSLQEATRPLPWAFGAWPEKYRGSRRRLFCDAMKDYRWNLFFAQSIGGTEVDADLPPERKVVIPADLLEVLRNAKVNGVTVIDDQGEDIVQPFPAASSAFFSPVVAAMMFFLVVLASVVFRWRAMRFVVLAVYGAFAAFYTYLIGVSSLPATSWHWLGVPFNLLPLVLWKWRRRWSLPFCVVLLGWEAFALFSPQPVTDPAFCLVVAAYLVYFAQFMPWERLRK